MIIDCVSDLHGFYPKLSGGDLLIVAGDLTARDHLQEHLDFAAWLIDQDYEKIILICGNHDGEYESVPYQKFMNLRRLLWDRGANFKVSFLLDSGCEFRGLKIWGSPWTPTFGRWHFMKDRGEAIKKKWDLIPDDTQILVTHGPPFGIQDEVGSNSMGCKLVGCEELRITLDRLKDLKLHVFGHIHDSYGKVVVNGVIHVNACIMNEKYRPTNAPITIEL